MWTRILFSLILWEIGNSITIDDCPDLIPRDEYLRVFDDKCYYFYLNVRKEYDDAQSTCRGREGNLASVKSERLNNLLWRNLRNRYNFEGNVWIGLSDEDSEGEYEWRDGSKMHYSNFEGGAGPKTPTLDFTNRYQDCVAMRAKTGEWTDLSCSDSIFYKHHEAFVCEYSPKPYSGPQASKDDCPPDVLRNKFLKVLDDKCYYFYLDTKLEFPRAQGICESHGGNLVSVKTEKVQNFIWKALKFTYKVNEVAWIGLSDQDNEGEYVWIDGSTMEYHNFKIGQGSSDCVVMDAESGKWYDYVCTDSFLKSHRYRFICEFPADIRPKQTTTVASTAPTPYTEAPVTTVADTVATTASTKEVTTPVISSAQTTKPQVPSSTVTTTAPITSTSMPSKAATTGTSSTVTNTAPIMPSKTAITGSSTIRTTRVTTTKVTTPATTPPAITDSPAPVETTTTSTTDETKAPTTTTPPKTTTTTTPQTTTTETDAPTSSTSTVSSTTTAPAVTSTTTLSTTRKITSPTTTTAAPSTFTTTTTSTTTTTTSATSTSTATTATTTNASPTDTTSQETDLNPTTKKTTSFTTSTQSATSKETTQPTMVSTTCSPIVCDLDCGMSGFENNANGCMICQCQEE